MTFRKPSLYQVAFWLGLGLNAFSAVLNLIFAYQFYQRQISPTVQLEMVCVGAISIWVIVLINVRHTQRTALHLKHMADLDIQMAMHKEMFDRIKQSGIEMMLQATSDDEAPRH